IAPASYVLNTTANGTLNLSGSGGLQTTGLVMVDSSSRTALTSSGGASLTAGAIRIVGGYSWGSSGALNPTPVTGAASVPDPLAALPAPTGGVSRGSVNLSGGTLTINPGIYTSITLSGSARLILNPGVYVLAGGAITVGGSASMSVGGGVDPVT